MSDKAIPTRRRNRVLIPACARCRHSSAQSVRRATVLVQHLNPYDSLTPLASLCWHLDVAVATFWPFRGRDRDGGFIFTNTCRMHERSGASHEQRLQVKVPGTPMLRVPKIPSYRIWRGLDEGGPPSYVLTGEDGWRCPTTLPWRDLLAARLLVLVLYCMVWRPPRLRTCGLGEGGG